MQSYVGFSYLARVEVQRVEGITREQSAISHLVLHQVGILGACNESPDQLPMYSQKEKDPIFASQRSDQTRKKRGASHTADLPDEVARDVRHFGRLTGSQ